MAAAAKRPTRFLFIGNPGVGKSTILNCYIGPTAMEHPFESGISWGEGKTKMFQSKSVGPHMYIDTPGLADRKLREQAAAAIKEGLTQGGFYKIFFVMMLTNGRVRAEDVTTMQLVLQAAPIRDYGIILNQLRPKQYQALRQNEEVRNALLSSLWCNFPSEKQTPHVHFVADDPRLSEERNAIMPLPADLISFISRVPGTVIHASAVTDVPCDLKHAAEQLAERQEALRNYSLVQEKFRKDMHHFLDAEAECTRNLQKAEPCIPLLRLKIATLESEVDDWSECVAEIRRRKQEFERRVGRNPAGEEVLRQALEMRSSKQEELRHLKEATQNMRKGIQVMRERLQRVLNGKAELTGLQQALDSKLAELMQRAT